MLYRPAEWQVRCTASSVLSSAIAIWARPPIFQYPVIRPEPSAVLSLDPLLQDDRHGVACLLPDDLA